MKPRLTKTLNDNRHIANNNTGDNKLGRKQTRFLPNFVFFYVMGKLFSGIHIAVSHRTAILPRHEPDKT